MRFGLESAFLFAELNSASEETWKRGSLKEIKNVPQNVDWHHGPDVVRSCLCPTGSGRRMGQENDCDYQWTNSGSRESAPRGNVRIQSARLQRSHGSRNLQR